MSVAIFRKKDGKYEVMVGKRKNKPSAGEYALPGGHVDDGETPVEAAARELDEETSVSVPQDDLIFVERQTRYQDDPDRQRIDSIFCALVDSDTKGHASSDITKIKWLGMGELDGLAFNHDRAIKSALRILEAQEEKTAALGALKNRGILVAFEGVDGSGKCFGKDTPILMSDGTTKKVQDIQEGDLVMGDDSTPRRVSGITRGRELLYLVRPTKGEPYIINASHILALKAAGNAMHRFKEFAHQPFLNIPVKDYLGKSPVFKRHALGYRKAVNFPEAEVRIDPYFLGVWLGDGTSAAPEITSTDPEVVACLYTEGKRRGLEVKLKGNKTITYTLRNNMKHNTRNGNSLINDLKSYGLINNKHVPFVYKKNSRTIRLEILAGLLDTDGSLSKGCFDFVNKSRILADDVVFLARSLGLAAYLTPCRKGCQTGAVGTYFRVCISGDCSIIPTRIKRKRAQPRHINKDPLSVGISLEPIGEGDYYGFAVDGNHLFLLGDFTVVHNSTSSKSLYKWLNQEGYLAIRTKWNSSQLLDGVIDRAKEDKELTPMLFSLLHAADLVHRYENVIDPALRRNAIVICDRYTQTSLVRDGLRGVPDSMIRSIYAGMRKPDVIFHCDIPVDLAVSRLLTEKGELSYYSAGMDLGLASSKEECCLKYERLMDKKYQELLKDMSSCKKLDMTKSEDSVAETIQREMGERFEIGS